MNGLRWSCAALGLALALGAGAAAGGEGRDARSWDRGSRPAAAERAAGKGVRLIKVHRGGYYRGFYPRSSVVISSSLWWPLGYPYYGWPYAGWPYYGYAPPVTVYESVPEPAITAQPPAPSWYYCPESKAYYPYVTECPRGWENVPATPADRK